MILGTTFIAILGAVVAVAILTVLVLGPALRVGSDRSRGTLDPPPWRGRYAVCYEQLVRIPEVYAQQLGAAALRDVTKSDVVPSTDRSPVSFTNRWGVLNHAERELGIAWVPANEGVVFTCCCRPRYRRELLNLGMSEQMGRRLVRRTAELAGGPAGDRRANA